MDADDSNAQRAKMSPLTLTDAKTGERHDIAHETLIGREVECSISLDSPHVSRYHAKILVGSEHTTIEDLNSSNGTFVNGKRIKQATSISLGDEISFDSHRFRLTSKDAGQSDATVVLSKERFASAAETLKPTDSHTNVPESTSPDSDIYSSDEDSTRMLSSAQINNIAEINKNLRKFNDTGSGPRFVATTAPIRGKVFELKTVSKDNLWRFGRSRDCELSVSAPSISRHHGTIRKENGRFYFSSEPGKSLRINGVEKSDALLKHNDQILIGPIEFIFRLDEQQAPPSKTFDQYENESSLTRVVVISGAVVLALVAIFGILVYQSN